MEEVAQEEQKTEALRSKSVRQDAIRRYLQFRNASGARARAIETLIQNGNKNQSQVESSSINVMDSPRRDPSKGSWNTFTL